MARTAALQFLLVDFLVIVTTARTAPRWPCQRSVLHGQTSIASLFCHVASSELVDSCAVCFYLACRFRQGNQEPKKVDTIMLVVQISRVCLFACSLVIQ